MDVLGILGFHRGKKLQQIPRRNRSYSLPENRYIPRVPQEPTVSEESEPDEESEEASVCISLVKKVQSQIFVELHSCYEVFVYFFFLLRFTFMFCILLQVKVAIICQN